ncbi:Hypothetical protein CINCED_3A018916 [Cinara cedri]|uniref:Uncharacterized protein n=1 Tax=Cinara cedri TaxID=506608 RepID=A0A5E4N7E2_9HEMI|nr:Hypothetical protein CINCED_3A018916 [Cinara cedri]
MTPPTCLMGFASPSDRRFHQRRQAEPGKTVLTWSPLGSAESKKKRKKTNAKKSGGLDELIETNLTFEHRFHWSKNIEYRSPWVEDMSREILNHVNKPELFGAQRQEILEHDDKGVSGIEILEADSIHNDCTSETDDSITYAVASKFCDTLMKHCNKTTDETPKCQCSSDEHYKWTKLYEKLVNCGRL